MAEFLERGFTASTMVRIAERAGIAKGTPYRYYRTKEDLFLALLREIVIDPLRVARETPILPTESIHGYCQRTLVPIMNVIEESGRATIARLALTEVRCFPEFTATYRREVYLPFLEHLGKLVGEGVSRGEVPAFHAADAPHLLAAPLWIGLVQNGILHPDEKLNIGALFARQIDLVFANGGRLTSPSISAPEQA